MKEFGKIFSQTAVSGHFKEKMGNRANLIIKESNKTKIYYSHWDGNITPRILSQGLKFCEKHFKKFNEDGWLMDNAWAEGGILIDKDNKNILFFSIEFLETVALQNTYIEFLKQNIWIDWNIYWAFKGNVDFAEYLNLMDNNILADGCIPNFYKIDEWNSLVEEIDSDWAHKSYVTIICNGTITDYVLFGHWTEINFCIAEGEILKDVIPEVFKISTADKIKEFEIEDILLVDYDTKNIYACWVYNTDDRHIEAIKNIWSGWNANRQTKGVSFNFEYSNREKLYTKITDKEFTEYLNEWKLLEYK